MLCRILGSVIIVCLFACFFFFFSFAICLRFCTMGTRSIRYLYNMYEIWTIEWSTPPHNAPSITPTQSILSFFPSLSSSPTTPSNPLPLLNVFLPSLLSNKPPHKKPPPRNHVTPCTYPPTAYHITPAAIPTPPNHSLNGNDPHSHPFRFHPSISHHPPSHKTLPSTHRTLSFFP